MSREFPAKSGKSSRGRTDVTAWPAVVIGCLSVLLVCGCQTAYRREFVHEPVRGPGGWVAVVEAGLFTTPSQDNVEIGSNFPIHLRAGSRGESSESYRGTLDGLAFYVPVDGVEVKTVMDLDGKRHIENRDYIDAGFTQGVWVPHEVDVIQAILSITYIHAVTGSKRRIDHRIIMRRKQGWKVYPPGV